MKPEDHQTLAGILDKLEAQGHLLRSLSSSFYATGNEFMGDTLGAASETVIDQVKALEKLREKVTDDVVKDAHDATGNMIAGMLAVASQSPAQRAANRE